MVTFHSSEKPESQISPWRQGPHRGRCGGQLWATDFSAERGEEEPSPCLLMGETRLEVSHPFASHGRSYYQRRVLLPSAKHRDFACALSDTREERNFLESSQPPIPSWATQRTGGPFSHYKRVWGFVQIGQQSSKDEEERTYSTFASRGE